MEIKMCKPNIDQIIYVSLTKLEADNISTELLKHNIINHVTSRRSKGTEKPYYLIVLRRSEDRPRAGKVIYSETNEHEKTHTQDCADDIRDGFPLGTYAANRRCKRQKS